MNEQKIMLEKALLMNSIESIRKFLTIKRKLNCENINKSENSVISLILNRFNEIETIEFCEQLILNIPVNKRMIVLEALLSTFESYTPYHLVKARDDLKQLKLINSQIEKSATNLSVLLKQRSNICKTSKIKTDCYCCTKDIINAANNNGKSNKPTNNEYLIKSEELEYDQLPDIAEVISCISDDASKAKVVPKDLSTKMGIKSKRPSISDSIRSFYATIQKEEIDSPRIFEDTCKISNKSMASIFNIGLNLSEDDIIGEEQFKTAKYRVKQELKNYR